MCLKHSSEEQGSCQISFIYLRKDHDPAASSLESFGPTGGSTLSPPSVTKNKNQHRVHVHAFRSKVDEFSDLGILSFDVCEGSLRQLHQLCVSHCMDSGGSWLFG